MAIGDFVALVYLSHGLQKSDSWILAALYFIVLQLLIATRLALLFSSFSSPIVSAVLAFASFVIGRFAVDLRSFAAMANGIVHWLATRAVYLLPNLSAPNIVSSVAHGQPVAGSLIFYNTLYALFYGI